MPRRKITLADVPANRTAADVKNADYRGPVPEAEAGKPFELKCSTPTASSWEGLVA